MRRAGSLAYISRTRQHDSTDEKSPVKGSRKAQGHSLPLTVFFLVKNSLQPTPC